MTQHEQSYGMRDLAGLIEPTLNVVSISKPEPSLLSLNIVAVYRSEDDARNAVLALESVEADDGAVGLTVLDSHPPRTTVREPEIRGLDPEGVAADIVPRTLKGAIVGALVGAIAIGGVAALTVGGTAAVAGALGGLLLGAAIGAIWGAFARMGGSDAYRQSFVDTSADSVLLVSLHTANSVTADRGRELLAMNADREPYIARCDDHGIRLI